MKTINNTKNTDNARSLTDLQGLLNFDQFSDAVVHLLDGVVLGESHAPLVRDVVDAALSLGVLSAGAAHLQVVLGRDLFQLRLVGRQLGQLDVHGRTHGRAQVGGAESQETEPVIVREGNTLFNVVDSGHQPLVNLLQVTAHLHGDETEVVLLIAPHQEGLVLIVVDTTARGPEAASVGCLQETVTLLEQEVVIDELLLGLLGHASQGVEGTLEFTLESREGGGDLLFHLLVLGLSQAGVEGVALHGASAAHTGGDDELASRVQVAEGLDITPVLGGVLVGLLETIMVILDDGVEQVGEHCVRLSVRGVDSDTRVQVLNTWKRLRHNISFVYRLT